LLVSVGLSGYCQEDGPAAGSRINVAKDINTSIHAEPLDFRVNTIYNELGPMPTKDGKRLYFSREGYPGNIGGVDDEDIWYTEFDEASQSWSESVNMGSPLNNAGPNFITGVGRKGDTLLLANVYRKKGKMVSGVSVSIRVGHLWSFPVPINIEADYNIARRATYDLSHDRNALVIAQQKFDTRGNLDLYVAFRDPDSNNPYSGTESVNLGKVINTYADETSPWLAYDGKTLYFASDGHNGYGRMDLFKSTRLDDTWLKWSEPENLGPGINSVYDDAGFNFNPLSRYAYMARGLSSSNSDIFRIDMTSLFIDQGNRSSRNAGPIGQSPEIGETRVIGNVFSDDQSVISKNVLSELQGIVTYLQKNRTMNVLVSAHSQKHDSRDISVTLSKQRANSIVDYLVKNGIEKTRLTSIGLGHDIVVNVRANEANASSIRLLASSVEFKIINYGN
jgi:hypothetical protein